MARFPGVDGDELLAVRRRHIGEVAVWRHGKAGRSTCDRDRDGLLHGREVDNADRVGKLIGDERFVLPRMHSSSRAWREPRRQRQRAEAIPVRASAASRSLTAFQLGLQCRETFLLEGGDGLLRGFSDSSGGGSLFM